MIAKRQIPPLDLCNLPFTLAISRPLNFRHSLNVLSTQFEWTLSKFSLSTFLLSIFPLSGFFLFRQISRLFLFLRHGAKQRPIRIGRLEETVEGKEIFQIPRYIYFFSPLSRLCGQAEAADNNCHDNPC